MKKLLIVLSVFLAIIAIIIFELSGCGKKGRIKAANKATTANTNQISTIQHQLNDNDSTSHYKINQVIHSETEVIAGKKPQLDLFLSKKLDSVCKLLNIKNNQISQLEGEKLTAKGNITSNVVVDGSGLYEFDFNDCFLSGKVYVNMNTMEQKTDYQANLKIHGVEYIHHKFNFLFLHLGKVSIKRNMWTDCPNVEIDSIQDIEVIRH